MDRVKNLQQFEIQSDIPEEFMFSGIVPFDMKISNGIGTFTVYAIDHAEAVSKVNEYLKK